jgi:hypothetical protein
MMYLVTGLIVVWFAGLLFLAGQQLNDIRLVLNNLAPGARYSDFSDVSFLGFRIVASRINPAGLTETGRAHLKKAIRNERIMFAWMVSGFLLLVWASSHLKAS